MTDKTVEKSDIIVNKHDFFFEVPLYEDISIEKTEKDLFEGDVDAYSARNQFDTTYEIEAARMASYSGMSYYNYYEITLTCKRRGNDDRLRFIIRNENGMITKVGQDPSLADLHNSKIDRKYGKLLDSIDLEEFKKAIGLAAHGVGAGSLVYLRRVFERLIFVTFDNKQKELKITTAEFKLKRMDEKVELLKPFLPKEFSEMTSIYKILGAGIHELTENQCRKYFPALKLSIELILDEQIHLKKEALKNKKVKAALQNIHQELSINDEK